MSLFSAQQAPGAIFRERWPHVNAMVKRILNMEDVALVEWHGMFADVYQIAVWEVEYRDHIRDALTKTIREYVLNVQQMLMSNQDESSLLKAYIVQWNKFANHSEILSRPFKPLKPISGQQPLGDSNRSNSPEGSVKKIMLETWNTYIYEVLQQKLLDSAVKLIQSDRCGQLIDCSLVIGISESCVILSGAQSTKKPKYVTELERVYIEGTKSFYRSRIAEYVEEYGIRSYTEYARQKLIEEEARGRRYLETKTEYDSLSKLMDACVQLFVVDYMDQLLAEVPTLLREEDTISLRRFYDLIRRGPQGLHALLPLFEQYIKETGLEDIRTNAETMLKDADKYVCRLLDLYFRFSRIVQEAFNNDPLLLSSRDKAYQEIVNNTSVLTTELAISTLGSDARSVESRCPMLLATYCDLLLRKSPTNRRLTPDEIEQQLKNVLLVLKYVNSKDIFMRVYKSHLMRRLILETSADNEMEEMMVDRLREVGMPAEQVNKLGRMFQDIKLSHDFTASFKEAYKSNSLPNVAHISKPNLNADVINVLVLSGGSWFLQAVPKLAICLPSELEDVLPLVEEFYRAEHYGRSLVWQHHVSHGIVSFSSNQGRFELELTMYQIVILYAWNQRFDQELSLDSLLTATGLREAELRRTLWSLCAHPKMEQQLILCSPKVTSEKEFTESSQFRLNLNFSNTRAGKAQARRRFNLIGRLQLTHDPSNVEDSVAIVELRQFRAQEGIIKLMKIRKRMHHNELYKELVDLLRFQFVPSKRLLKEVLDWLLEHQYIRRDESDMNVFVYVT